METGDAPVIILVMDVELRIQLAHETFDTMHRLSQSAITQAVGMNLRQDRLQRSPLANYIQSQLALHPSAKASQPVQFVLHAFCRVVLALVPGRLSHLLHSGSGVDYDGPQAHPPVSDLATSVLTSNLVHSHAGVGVASQAT